ncbi:hypothetical protein Tco_1283539 [Tanacetum coccineum]
MICNMDSIGKYMLEIILHQQRTPPLLKQKKLMQTQEDHSNPVPALNVESLKVDLVVIQNTCSKKEDCNSETASSKSVKESSLDSATKDVHAIKYKMSKSKERCIAYFRSLHSHLQVLSKEDLKGTRIEHGFKRAFMSLFGQDHNTFTSTMFLNVDQLQKQLDKDKFQEDGSMAAFWVVNNQFQKFIDSQFMLYCDNQMTDKYFIEYTGIEVKHFKDTLLQHMGNVKKSVAERIRHQRQYDRRVNKRQMQTQESKIDTGKAVDDDLVVRESSGTESKVQDNNIGSGNDTDADDADIRPIYDEEPMAKVGLTRQHGQILNEKSNKAKIKKEIDVLETMNIELEHSVAKLRTENETLKKHYKDLYDSIKITISKTIEQTTSLLANNVDLKAQIQEKVFAIASLKNDLRKLKENIVDTKFAKTSVLEKSVLQSLRKQSVVRQPNSFKSERPQMSKLRFASQVDIFARHRFSPNKTPAVYDKTSSRSDLRWKPMGRIIKSIGLRWIPTGKLFDSCTRKVDSEPPHGSNVDIPNIHEYKQTLDLSAGTLINVQKEQSPNFSAGILCNVNKENLRVWLLKKLISQKPLSK